MQTDEETLIRRLNEGDEEAFAGFVREHQGPVRGYVSQFVRDSFARDDVAQETFYRAYRSLRTFRGESSPRVWLLGIARHVALQYLREVSRLAPHEPRELSQWLDSRLLGRCEEEEDPARKDKEVAALIECIESLPSQNRKLVRTFYFDRQSAATIAERLKISANSVYLRLFRIRGALHECIAERLGMEKGST